MSRNADSINVNKKLVPFNLKLKNNSKGEKAQNERLSNAIFLSKFCPVCGKEFCPTPGWAYKAKANKSAHCKVQVCSYGCMRKVEKRNDTGKKPVIRRGI